METEINTQKAVETALQMITKIKAEKPELTDNFYLVGNWIWFESEEEPSDEVVAFLKANGFKWNKARNLWQNSCGIFSKKSTGDPRNYYGIIGLDKVRLGFVAEPSPKAIK